jgi:hypothetical protein
VAKPSGVILRLAALFSTSVQMPRSTSDEQWRFWLLIILYVIVVIIATSGWIYFLTKMALWLFVLIAE